MITLQVDHDIKCVRICEIIRKIAKQMIRLNSNQAIITITTPNMNAIVKQERKRERKENKTNTLNNKK